MRGDCNDPNHAGLVSRLDCTVLHEVLANSVTAGSLLLSISITCRREHRSSSQSQSNCTLVGTLLYSAPGLLADALISSCPPLPGSLDMIAAFVLCTWLDHPATAVWFAFDSGDREVRAASVTANTMYWSPPDAGHRWTPKFRPPAWRRLQEEGGLYRQAAVCGGAALRQPATGSKQARTLKRLIAKLL